MFVAVAVVVTFAVAAVGSDGDVSGIVTVVAAAVTLLSLPWLLLL